jgi:DNA-binding CsgD family transcriptional regulator
MLVGRVAEQRELDGLLARARDGLSGVLVLRGEPGIGKTALTDYAASQAESGSMSVWRVTGVEAETELAFAGLYSLLLPVTSYLPALPERQAAALEAALGLGNLGNLGNGGTGPDRLAVAAGTHTLMTTAAEDRPLLIVVDDLHWLDTPSREALLFALRRLDRDAIACVLTTRAEAPGPPGPPGQPGPGGPAGLACRELIGLGPDAAAELIRAVAGSALATETAKRLMAETAGNPLALVELSAALTPAQLGGAALSQSPLPPGVGIRERFAARLDRLSPAARTVLTVAAAAGRCPAADVTAAALGLEDGVAGGVPPGGPRGGGFLGEAEEAGLVRVTAEGISFSHPLLRSVAYHAAPPAQRRAAHRSLAAVLADRDPERAAWHLAAAATGPDEEAAAALEAAARLAEAKGAPQSAAAAAERAAELSTDATSRLRRLAQAAEAALGGGDLARALRLTDALPAAAAAGSGDSPARLLAVRGHVHLLTGKMDAAQRDLQRAADLIGDRDPALAVELLSDAAEAALEAGLIDQAATAAGQMADLAGQSDEATRFVADYKRGEVAWWQGDLDRGMPLIERAVTRLETDPLLAANPRYQLALCNAWSVTADFDKARLCADRAIELARVTGALGQLPTALAALTFLDNTAGRWPRALAHASQLLGLARDSSQPLLVCEALVTMAEIEAGQGRDGESRQHAREADQLAGELGLRLSQFLARRSRALLELGRGRAAEAIALYQEVRRLGARWQITHPYYSVVPDLIEAYAWSGALDSARELLGEFLAQVPAEGNPPAAARAARCRGILAADGYDAHFLAAIALHERGEVAFQHARTRLCYGERLRRGQRRRDARVQLRVAAEIFDHLDARPWAERARTELRASGETIAAAGLGGEQLTPQELQIAMLVTAGKTNAEIGRAVFLSTRTVEFHLSRAYRKLGVTSRTELTRHLAAAGTLSI